MGTPAASSMPVGYRFHPTDEELVGHYLMFKLLLGDESRVQDVIAEVDVCKFEPWDLPAFSKVKSDDHEWFFFSPRDLKYTNSNRSNRATNAGYWKATGKDRKIKTRGTNDVIGTKKTLVFHKGRVPHGVKTNWVIHEYHAVTFPVDMRAFVLCRLIEKAEKRTDELINEGEPIAADHENQASADRIPDVYTLPEVTRESIFLVPPQADECDFPSLQYSPIITNREPFQDSTFTDIYFEDENNITQFPFDTTEDEDDVDLFLNSTLVDEDVVISEERRDAFVNDSTPSQSLGQVYYESSETDVELVSAKYGNVSGTTSACKHAVSSRLQPMRMVDTPQDVVYAGPVSLSSTTKVNREKKNSTFGDNFGGVDLSDDSTANKPLPVSVIKNFSSPSPPRATSSSSSTSRRSKSKYHPRSDNFVSRRAAPRPQTQRKVSIAVSQHEVQKETRMLESNKDQRTAYDAKSRKNSETSCNQSSCVNEKGSFIDLKAPSMSHNPNPRSLYLVNVIIGFSLLIVTIWDMVSFGRLC